MGITFFNKLRTSIVAAFLFGVGAALTLDEFALWLNLEDVYWAKEGRISVDVVVAASVFLLAAYVITRAPEPTWVDRVLRRLGVRT
jgi:hypothetical protein